MEAFFLIVHVLLAVALIGIVLIQRSSNDGFGLGSGSGANFMSGRQAANLLTRATAIIATLFMLNSLWLGWMATHKDKVSLADQIEAASPPQSTDEKSAKTKEGKKLDEKVGRDDTKADAPVDKPSGDQPADAKAPKASKEAPAVPVAE